jgi:hypothetical protein
MIKSIQFEHNFERLTDGSRLMLAEFTPQQLAKVAAVRIKRLFVNHFTAFHARNPNQFGAPRQGIYADFARATNSEVKPTEAIVSTTHVAILQKVYGGVIKPRQKKYLTLPAIAEAYGKPARDFPAAGGLKVATVDLSEADYDYIPESWRGRETGKALVENDVTVLSKDFFKKSGQKKQIWEKAERRGGKVIYWLLRSVNQKPTEGVVPTRDQIETELYAAVDMLFKQRFGPGSLAQTTQGPTIPRPIRIE